MMDFSEEAADATLKEIAEACGGTFTSGGGFRQKGACSYDSYVALDHGRNRTSIAIRRRQDGHAYFAIKRKWNGRNVVEDRIPIAEKGAAIALFNACVTIARLGNDAQTLGMIVNDAAQVP